MEKILTEVEMKNRVGVKTSASSRISCLCGNYLRKGLARTDARGPSVLLIDDQKDVLYVGAGMLQALGYDVLTAESGEEAMEIYRDQINSLGIVILDLNMPGMGGAEVYGQITDLDPNMGVIFISGADLDDDLKKDLESGNTRFLRKPFELKDLSMKLNDLMGGVV